MVSDYTNGYIERQSDGGYRGRLRIDGVDISPIEGVYFAEEGNKYLWLKRKRILEYDNATRTYKEREREPRWEAYLQKMLNKDAVEWRGTFTFMRWRYSIVGIWDNILGDANTRLNLYVERLPMAQQTILNNINNRKHGTTKSN